MSVRLIRTAASLWHNARASFSLHTSFDATAFPPGRFNLGLPPPVTKTNYQQLATLLAKPIMGRCCHHDLVRGARQFRSMYSSLSSFSPLTLNPHTLPYIAILRTHTTWASLQLVITRSREDLNRKLHLSYSLRRQPEAVRSWKNRMVHARRVDARDVGYVDVVTSIGGSISTCGIFSYSQRHKCGQQHSVTIRFEFERRNICCTKPLISSTGVESESPPPLR